MITAVKLLCTERWKDSEIATMVGEDDSISREGKIWLENENIKVWLVKRQ